MERVAGASSGVPPGKRRLAANAGARSGCTSGVAHRPSRRAESSADQRGSRLLSADQEPDQPVLPARRRSPLRSSNSPRRLRRRRTAGDHGGDHRAQQHGLRPPIRDLHADPTPRARSPAARPARTRTTASPGAGSRSNPTGPTTANVIRHHDRPRAPRRTTNSSWRTNDYCVVRRRGSVDGLACQ